MNEVKNMVDVSKKHRIDGLTVYSKSGTKTPDLMSDKGTSREEIGKETVNIDEIKKRLQKPPSTSKKKAWIVVGIIVAILVLSGVSVWFVLKKPTFLGSKVVFDISAPQEAVSGADFSYTIEYSNEENVPLENVEIEAFYPDGFVFLSSDPVPWENTSNVWKFDRISQGAKEKIVIQGKLLGEIDSTKKCKVKLTYRPQNVSSAFTHETEAVCKITSSALALMGELPEVTASDTEIIWTIRYSNIESSDIDNIKIEATYSEGFEFESSKPESTQENIWENLTLKANEEAELKIKGKISGTLDETIAFKAQIGVIDSQGKFWLQQEIENSTKIIETDVRVDHTQDKEIVNLGDLIEYKTTLKNTGSIAVENIVITNEIDTDLLDGTSIEVEDGKFDGEKIVWSKESLDSLASIEPEGEVQVSFKIKVTQAIKVQKAEDKNFVIKNKAKVEGRAGGKETAWESNEVSSKILTTITLRSEGHYVDYEGRQVGSGPIPPQVGKATSYIVYWSLTNKTNDIEKTKVTAVLPKDVKWTGKTTVSSGIISFDSKTNEVIWDIEKISANSGSILPGLEATFEISITPKESDLGKVLSLLGETSVLGADSFCNTEILDSTNAITTDLEYDVKAKGKGKVVEGKEKSKTKD